MKTYEAPFYTKEQLEELDESQIHFPFSDDDAVYIGKTHQYELTSKYFQERYNLCIYEIIILNIMLQMLSDRSVVFSTLFDSFCVLERVLCPSTRVFWL